MSDNPTNAQLHARRMLDQMEAEEKDERLQEEILKEKISEIYQHWHKFSFRYILALGIPAFLAVMVLTFTASPFVVAFLCGGGGWLIVSASRLGRWHSLKRFMRKITPEEYELIESVSTMRLSEDERKFVTQTRIDYAKINPQAEYLRASQKAEDDTLLRAAAYTDATQQDQLLRSADNADEV